jgi:magnesium-transporting ATPase (P-type)
MNWARWERFAPLTGIVAVVLWVVGVILEGSTDYSEKDTPQEILTVVQEDTNTLITAGIIFAFGVVFFIWFLGSLRAALYSAEGGVGRLTSIAYGSGLLAALCLLLQVAPTVQAAFDEDDLSADAAQSLQSMGEAFFGGTELTLIAMFVAVGLVILRTRVLGLWLGWVSLAIALLLAIIPIGWAGVVWAFPLWTIVTSVLLYLRGPGAPAAAPRA